MTVEQMLAGIRLRSRLPDALAGFEVQGLDYDSRKIQKGFVFFAFAGSRNDGRQLQS